jgi:flagellar basal body rod protein FlgG
MNRGIYAPASAMMNNERLLDVVANNLANASTTGFKRDGLTFKETMELQMSANGGQGGGIGAMGLAPNIDSQYTSMEPGPINITNRPLDLAIATSRGMFAVQSENGVQFTRDGSFRVGSDGTLQTADGKAVLDSSYRAIEIPPGDVAIGDDGTVVVKTRTEGIVNAGQIAVFTGSFSKVGNNNWTGVGTNAVPTPRIHVGALEGSNVSPVEEMIELIRIGRNYEMQQKAVSQQDELNQKLTTALS